MGILIRHYRDSGVFAPICVCDVCGRQIEDGRLAGVVHDMGKADSFPMFAHKGSCMNSLLDKRGPDNLLGWAEFGTAIADLSANCGYKVPEGKSLGTLFGSKFD